MIRIAIASDLERITEIYNQAVMAGFQTGFTEPVSVANHVAWFNAHQPDKYPILVCVEDNKLMGWISISPYRAGRAALRYTVELSYFVDNQCLYRGVGSQLMEAALSMTQELNYKTALAIILSGNSASTRLAEKFGFTQWGFLPGIADFGGIECDHLYYGKKLNV